MGVVGIKLRPSGNTHYYVQVHFKTLGIFGGQHCQVEQFFLCWPLEHDKFIFHKWWITPPHTKKIISTLYIPLLMIILLQILSITSDVSLVLLMLHLSFIVVINVEWIALTCSGSKS